MQCGEIRSVEIAAAAVHVRMPHCMASVYRTATALSSLTRRLTHTSTPLSPLDGIAVLLIESVSLVCSLTAVWCHGADCSTQSCMSAHSSTRLCIERGGGRY